MSYINTTQNLTVQDLIKDIRLEEEVAKVFDLVGSGRYLRTRKHDSLVIDTDNQRFYWNSRQIAGDVVDWLMLQNGWDFWQTIRYLCEVAGIGTVENIHLLPRKHPLSEPKKPLPLTPPSVTWRRRAQEVVEQAHIRLWMYEHRAAKAYLH